ncbi:unnamed protein product [Psylliodes chrysocephalus]|uniref:Uncharacterized protein n=1 Tax=Psylliodes chrysocephalus TaxID=3402493 RepID=A0A9P0CVU9_9CUCU|nr:unnamed protein product [Psylliodes chrysocephala]
MFSRFLKLREPLISTPAILNVQHRKPNQNDWNIIQYCCDALKYFDEITVHISSEKNVTISKIIVYIARRFTNKNIENIPVECQNMSEGCYERDKVSITELCSKAAKVPLCEIEINIEAQPAEKMQPEKKSIWDEYDQQTSHLTRTQNATAASVVEVNRYIQEPLLKRSEDPLQWWYKPKEIYPRLKL